MDLVPNREFQERSFVLVADDVSLMPVVIVIEELALCMNVRGGDRRYRQIYI